MTNYEISTILRDISHLLLIQGEEPFRARVYERPANAIDELTTDVVQLATEDKLQSIPGIGKAIDKKIREFLETGSFHFYDVLVEEMGRGVLDLLTIRGVGVKTASRFYGELGVRSLEDLRVEIDGERIQALKGIGSKTIAQIREGLHFVDAQSQMRPLWLILPIAQMIRERLKSCSEIARVDFTGELRRHEEMLRSLEFTSEGVGPARIWEVLAEVDGVEVLKSKDDNRFGLSSVETSVDNGFPVRVFVLDAATYDAGLFVTTATSDHLVAFNEVAEAQDLEKFDGCFPDWSKDANEAAMYNAVRLPYVIPELRRTGDSIATALTGGLPTSIELSDFRGDLHVHSNWSDGRNTIREMVEAAKLCGHAYIAITDHSESSRVANGLTPDRLYLQIEEVRKINREINGIQVLTGSEVDIRRDGSLDFSDEILAQLDIVVASVHSGFELGEVEMTQRVIRAIENPFVKILGHPTGRLLGQRPGYAINLDAVIQAAVSNDVVLEINASPSRLDLEPDIVRQAREAGALLAVNTDAHATSQLGQLCFGINVARRGWLQKEEVINSYQLGALCKVLQIRTP